MEAALGAGMGGGGRGGACWSRVDPGAARRPREPRLMEVGGELFRVVVAAAVLLGLALPRKPEAHIAMELFTGGKNPGGVRKREGGVAAGVWRL